MRDEQEPTTQKGVISVEGASLGYRIEGNGIPCLVPGGSINCSRIFSPELRDRFRLHFVDTRGFVPTIEPYDVRQGTLDTYSDDLETARRALGLGKVLVIGHSIHGTQALEYARRYPESVWGVAAIAAPAKLPSNSREFFEQDASPDRKATLRANAPRLAPEALRTLDPSNAFIETYVANSPLYWYDPHYDAAPLWDGVYVNVPQVEHLFGTLYATYNFALRSGQITTPTLIALGRYDYVVPYAQWDEQKLALPRHTYALFERSGHTPQLEEAARFNRTLIEWTQAVTGSAISPPGGKRPQSASRRDR